MPSVHVIKGIIGSVSKYSDGILATIREKIVRSSVMTMVQELSDFSLRTQDIGRTINVLDKANKGWEGMKSVSRKNIIRSGYAEVTQAGRSRYITIVESDVRNIRTGELSTRYNRIYHNDPAFRFDIEQEATDIIIENEVSPDLEVLDQRPVQGFVFR